jgi:PAS domain S-box-containing protein
MEFSEAPESRNESRSQRSFPVGSVPLSMVIITDKLATRPPRDPAYKAENEALVSLAETLAEHSTDVLHKLAEQAGRLCGAHSAGVSIAEEEHGEPIFRWHAISGKLAHFLNGTMPRYFSPCGEVLDRKSPLLMQFPIRHYPYISGLGIDLCEVLLVPFSRGTDVIGTVWVIAHDQEKVFDREDLRCLQSLCKFASTAVVALQNIKALEDTSRRLQDVKARMETALNVGAIATWVWDVDTNRLHLDCNFSKLFGIHQETGGAGGIELFIETIHPDDRAHVRQVLDASLESRQGFEAEYRLQVPGQHLRWVSARGCIVEDERNHGRMVTGAVIDITERRRMMDQLRMKTEQLAEASKRKDEFLATLSHELRSPLNIIQGHTELLRLETPGSMEFEESLDAIERSTRLQTQLISDMLDVSRIITGKMLLNITVFDPKDIVLDAVRAIQYAADAKSLQLHYDIEEDSGLINGDRGRLQQALWNFLANAVKFSQPGGQIFIRVHRKNGHIEFSVSDQGHGIDPDFLPNVFDRFHQEDGSKSRKHGGLGLGLAIVRHIAELHGGSVQASSPGKSQGATFTLSIPVVAMVDDLHQPHAETESPCSRKTSRAVPLLAHRSILVVDDQSDAASLLKRSLEMLGASVLVASSAESAWLQLELTPFDILISDIGMPELNGFDLIKTWRSKERMLGRRPMPAIALTAYGTREDRSEILEAGYTAHLAKPAGLRELTETILQEITAHP